MKAILIDPYTNTVSEVEHNGDYREIYKKIDCECFTCVNIEDDDTIFVDDEGLLKLTEETRFFVFDGYPQPLAGKGLVLGTDDAGETVAVKATLQEIRERVKFYSIHEVRRLGM